MTITEHLTDMRHRADNALSNLQDTHATTVEVPAYTDTERRLNYWNGFLAALNEITDTIAQSGV